METEHCGVGLSVQAGCIVEEAQKDKPMTELGPITMRWLSEQCTMERIWFSEHCNMGTLWFSEEYTMGTLLFLEQCTMGVL